METIERQFAQVLSGEAGDLASFYRRAREHGPFFSPDFNGWVVSSHADVSRVLTDETCFRPLGYGAGSSIIHGRTILHMEGEEHRKKSALLARHLRSPRLLDGVQRDFVVQRANELIDSMPRTGSLDLKAGFTTPLPLDVTAWLMGIEEAPNFRETYDTIVAAGASNLRGDQDVQRRGEEARAKLFAFLTPLIQQRRRDPAEDLLSVLCSTEYEGTRLSDDEIRSFSSFLLAAGVETTDRALSSLLSLLWQRLDVWQELSSDREVLRAACAEGLRFSPPVHALSRGVEADAEMSGTTIRAGDRIVALMAAANRDPDVFDNPDEFVLRRFAQQPDREFGAKAQILSFGYGTHLCTGSQLARLEMVEGLNVLLDRIATVHFTEGVPPESGYVLRSPEHLKVHVEFQ